jgi:DNA mismatch repair protein MutS
MKKLTPLLKQYYRIKEKYCDMILFFRLGDFYEMFGEEAVKIAPIIGVVLTQRAGSPMCGVPCSSANTYIKKLLVNGFKIAICEQLGKSKRDDGIIKREVVKVITPGTIVEDALLESKENNFLMSIFFNETNMSIAYAVADVSTGEFITSETTLFGIETEILKYNPGEIIISENNKKNKYISHFIYNFGIPISFIDNYIFNIEKIEKNIDIFLKNNKINFNSFNDEIICVCCALIYYINKMQPQSINIFSNINYVKKTDFMYLDATAIKNLELVNSSKNDKKKTLFSVMNSTKTSMGMRTLRKWVLNPLFNSSKIIERQKIIKFFIKNIFILNNTCKKLKIISDIERIVAKISSCIATPKDMIGLKKSLKIINDILNDIKQIMNIDYIVQENVKVIDKISYYLFDNSSAFLKDGNVIKSGVNNELDKLRETSFDIKKYISDLETNERKINNINNLKIRYTSIFGYYIEVTKSNLHLVPKHYIRKQTVTSGERYITNELMNIEEKILLTKERIFKLENDIFNELNIWIFKFIPNILKVSNIISEIDILCGFATNALEYNYVCPNISNDLNLFIKNGRHPVVEKMTKKGEFIENDIIFDNNNRIMIITAPNMSGKSTYLRQTALIIIMAQIGSFVPATNAIIGLVDKIFTRIGAADNIINGESTFMVEMNETSNILKQYTEKSLIILDEVGRGTSTLDGISIAFSIIEFFIKSTKVSYKIVKILFATHYFELANMFNKFKCIVNYSIDVKEWCNDIIFLHKIIKKKNSKSYGIYVAKISGIPIEIINRAYEILSILETKGTNTVFLDNVVKDEQKLKNIKFNDKISNIFIELKNIDIDTLTPIKAFNIICNLKNKYKL